MRKILIIATIVILNLILVGVVYTQLIKKGDSGMNYIFNLSEQQIKSWQETATVKSFTSESAPFVFKYPSHTIELYPVTVTEEESLIRITAAAESGIMPVATINVLPKNNEAAFTNLTNSLRRGGFSNADESCTLLTDSESGGIDLNTSYVFSVGKQSCHKALLNEVINKLQPSQEFALADWTTEIVLIPNNEGELMVIENSNKPYLPTPSALESSSDGVFLNWYQFNMRWGSNNWEL